MRLAARLSDSSLGGKVFFCNSGAEANEAAIKLARKARPGGDVVVVHGAFHGRTYGALSATPQEAKQAPFAPLVPGLPRGRRRRPQALAAAVDANTAAVLLEPIQGETGVHVLSAEMLLRGARGLRRARRGSDLRRDPVRDGPHGHALGLQQTGVVPDAMTLAKALGGGLPIGALVTGERARRRARSRAITARPSRGGPVIASAALAALEATDDERLLAAVRELGEAARGRPRDPPHVTAVRGRGLMLACELDVPAPEVARRALLEQRLIVNATGPTTLRLLPPLTIGADDAEEAVRRLARALSATASRIARASGRRCRRAPTRGPIA